MAHLSDRLREHELRQKRIVKPVFECRNPSSEENDDPDATRPSEPAEHNVPIEIVWIQRRVQDDESVLGTPAPSRIASSCA